MGSDTVHIGVDVSKGKLDIYVPAKKEGARPVTKEVDSVVCKRRRRCAQRGNSRHAETNCYIVHYRRFHAPFLSARPTGDSSIPKMM